MIEIILSDKWRITSDKRNYILERKAIAQKGKQQGEVVWYSKSFYNSIQHLLNGLTEITLRESESKSIRDLQNSLKEVHDYIQEIKNIPLSKSCDNLRNNTKQIRGAEMSDKEREDRLNEQLKQIQTNSTLCRVCGKMGRYRGSIGDMEIWLCDECLPKLCEAITEYGMNHD